MKVGFDASGYWENGALLEADVHYECTLSRNSEQTKQVTGYKACIGNLSRGGRREEQEEE